MHFSRDCLSFNFLMLLKPKNFKWRLLFEGIPERAQCKLKAISDECQREMARRIDGACKRIHYAIS